MNLRPAELAQLLRIVDGVYEGKPAPRARGAFGQFLRGCERGRLDVQQALARHGLATHAAGWVDGDAVGPISLRLLGDLEATVHSDLWGPVERAPILCPQLGMVAELTLWTSARSANQVRVLLTREGATTVSLRGAYRWFAPARITPGESTPEIADDEAGWENARCLKTVAEDVGRPPHPLEYVFDYRFGRPGLKVFRVIAGRPSPGGLDVLPVTGLAPRRISLSASAPVEALLHRAQHALVFAFREPWEDTWYVVDAKPITPADCFNHGIAWADFRAEVLGHPALGYGDVAAVRDSLVNAGVAFDSDISLRGAELGRSLAPPAATLLRWFRFGG